MEELSPSSTLGSRAPLRRPPPATAAAVPASDDSETKINRLSFGVPKTPATPTDDQAAQIASLLQTVADLEKTSRRTQAENERLIALRAASDPDSNEERAAKASSTEAAVNDLAAKLDTLTKVVITLANKQNHPAHPASQANTDGGAGNSNSDSDSDSDTDRKANSDSDRKANRKADRKPTDMDETGPEEDGTSASTSATPIDQDAQDTSKGAVMATPLLGG